jgi:hypothetical protein
MPAAEYRDRALDRLQTLVGDVEVRVRIRSERLLVLLEAAVWRTLFDGVESAGLNDVPARTLVEANVIGIPADADPSERPTYGYLAGSEEDGVTTYGDVILHLRDDTRNRVTFCLGDSLNSSDHGTYPVLAAALLEDPQLEARHGETDVVAAASLSEACDPRDGFAEAHIHGQVSITDIDWATFTQREPDSALLRVLLDNDIRFLTPGY